MEKIYKLMVGVPITHTAAVREAIGKAGAGKIGNYDYCTFTVRGVGRFRSLQGSNPTIGQVGEFTEVAEDKIETVCEEGYQQSVLKALKASHPYETPAVDVFPLDARGFFDQ